MKTTIAKLTFQDAKGGKHVLFYKLYLTNLARNWARMVKENKLSSNRYIHTTPFNFTKDDLHEIHENLTKTINKINSEYPYKIEYNEDTDLFSDDDLNYFHHMFEAHGDRINELEEKGLHRESSHINFLKLNELIHAYESALKIDDHEFPDMSMMCDYYPQEIFTDITSIDRIHLKNSHNWGELYLGYNTLGKDWTATCGDNDIELVNREEVRPQNRYAAEIFLCFRDDVHSSQNNEYFENWYYSLSNTVKSKVPIDNLSELSLGKFIIGELLITKELLNFDSNLNNWKVKRSDTRKRWNLEVFSKFKNITNIDIITT